MRAPRGPLPIQRFAAVVVDGADVRLVVQHAVIVEVPHVRLAGRRRDPAVEQVKRDLPDRRPVST